MDNHIISHFPILDTIYLDYVSDLELIVCPRC